MPSLVFLGLSVLDLGPMYATGRQTSDRWGGSMSATSDVRQYHRLMPIRGGGIIINYTSNLYGVRVY